MNERKYAIGIQAFEEIRREGYLYIDKTSYIYHMTHGNGKYYFLCRPRRFGKSLLVSTMHSYFSGRKDLFKGLDIEKKEKEWATYPVLHFDMSLGKYQEIEQLERFLDYLLQKEEDKYGITAKSVDTNLRLENLIYTIYRQTGKSVVVLIDEYDAPLLDVVHDNGKMESLRNVMRNFYSPLKACDPYLRFVFMTGITKFSQMSIFSELNNIKNVSMDEAYAGICGITQEEVENSMGEDVEILSNALHLSKEETFEALRDHYDGYHFTWPSPDVFNPYSLLNAFDCKRLNDFWFGTGTPTYLIKMMEHFEVRPSNIAPMLARASAFDAPTQSMSSITPLLYQSGYLTIKDYDSFSQLYTLDIPNREIRVGLFESLLPEYLAHHADEGDVTIARMSVLIRQDNMNEALCLLQTFLGTIPYCNNTDYEGHYQQLFFVIFTLLTNFLVDVEVHTATERVDMVLMTETRLFLMELKLNRSAADALSQINLKNYRARFALSRLPVTKVAVNFDSEKRNISDWVIE